MLKRLRQRFEGNPTGWWGVVLIVLISALTYLPNFTRFTYYRDDWYYMLDGLTGGSGIFHAMFSIDRPARGYLFEWLFQWFGLHPLPYHLSAYLWRLLSGLGALLLFRLLWPRQKQAGFWMALLFVLYPGYLWWVAGVEYQPMILSVCLQVISIALTLLALSSRPPAVKILSAAGAILSGWLYIFLVDYAIGMEVMRFLCVYVYMSRIQGGLPFLKQAARTLRAAWFYAVIPAGYLVWNLFLFQNQRAETDIGLQLSSLLASPFLTGAWWLVHLFQSVCNVAFFAWFMPFFQAFYALRLKVMLAGVLTAALVLVLLFIAGAFSRQGKNAMPDEDGEAPGSPPGSWQVEAFWIGLLGTVFGALPVVMANRSIVFNAFSHYALPASLGAAMLVVGFAHLIKRPLFQKGFLMSLAFLAVLTHASTAAAALEEEQAVQNFWWQVTWRVSGLQPGTTLLVNYPGVFYGEDEDIVWGPANLLYAPHSDASTPVIYPITALPQNYETSKRVIAGGSLPWEYRTHSGEFNFDKFLVISQPSQAACVHVMDPRWPRLSLADSDQMLLLARYSNLETLVEQGEPPRPPAMIFGAEPPHAWCFYYQKAELALSKGDWEQVASLGEEAAAQGFHPVERVEWMPFLQAAVHLGDEDRIAEIATMINEDSFLRSTACQTIVAMDSPGAGLPAGGLSLAKGLFCGAS